MGERDARALLGAAYVGAVAGKRLCRRARARWGRRLWWGGGQEVAKPAGREAGAGGGCEGPCSSCEGRRGARNAGQGCGGAYLLGGGMHEAHARSRPCQSLPFGSVTLWPGCSLLQPHSTAANASYPPGQQNRSAHHSEPSAGAPAASSSETTPCGEWALSHAGPTERHSMLASLHPVPGRDITELGRLRHPVPHCAELAGACSCWFSSPTTYRQQPLAAPCWRQLGTQLGCLAWLRVMVTNRTC